MSSLLWSNIIFKYTWLLAGLKTTSPKGRNVSNNFMAFPSVYYMLHQGSLKVLLWVPFCFLSMLTSPDKMFRMQNFVFTPTILSFTAAVPLLLITWLFEVFILYCIVMVVWSEACAECYKIWINAVFWFKEGINFSWLNCTFAAPSVWIIVTVQKSRYGNWWLLNSKHHFKNFVMKLKLKLSFILETEPAFLCYQEKKLVKTMFFSLLDHGDVLHMHASAWCLHQLDTVYHSTLRFVRLQSSLSILNSICQSSEAFTGLAQTHSLVNIHL